LQIVLQYKYENIKGINSEMNPQILLVMPGQVYGVQITKYF